MKVVISQPRYLPVISYLQRLAFADAFVLFDTVKRQYAGWENRNKLLLPEPKWVTIPISSSRMEIIRDARVRGVNWVVEHKNRILHNYRKHPHFNRSWLDAYYEGVEEMVRAGNDRFADIIERTLLNLAALFDFQPNIVRASSFETEAIRQARGPEKLLEICKALNADVYVSGENGRVYGVNEVFAGSGIRVKYHPAGAFHYPQPGRDTFVPYMGFFDALFCIGRDALAQEIQREPELG